MRLVIVSGISGSGKSIALHFLEDLGFYCIDNLPVGMLAVFSEYIATAEVTSQDRFAVGIDALNGQVRTHGWTDGAQLSPEILALQMRALGVRRIIYTDIDRDGLLGGINHEATGRLASASAMRVIASGGVAALDDVRAAMSLAPSGVDGVIIGRALYDGRISLAEALAVAVEFNGEENAG